MDKGLERMESMGKVKLTGPGWGAEVERARRIEGNTFERGGVWAGVREGRGHEGGVCACGMLRGGNARGDCDAAISRRGGLASAVKGAESIGAAVAAIAVVLISRCGRGSHGAFAKEMNKVGSPAAGKYV